MKGKRFFLMSSAVAAALACNAPAWAQAADQDRAGAPQDGGVDGSQASDTADIVVTAQRRSELARDVPISITALNGEQLATAGITDTSGLARLTPGLKIDRTGNFTVPSIRGITTSVTGPAQDANVAIYLDGVYQASTTSNTFDLPDVERVEVLKGPQGTLFGRNATGGAIQVITKEPSYSPTGAATLSYGNYDDVIVKGFVSAPIVDDKLAFSVAGFFQRNDSYYKDIRPGGPDLTGARSWLVRGKLRIDPADNLKITLTGFYSDREESLAIYGTPLNGNTAARRLDPAAIIPTKPFDIAFNDDVAPQRVKSYGLSAKLQLHLDAGTLTSLTSYSNYDLSNVLDADYSYTPNSPGTSYYSRTKDHYFSQELSFASALDGPLNFVVGSFYTEGQGGWSPLGVRTPAIGVTIYGTQKIETVAGFGEIYYGLTEKLSLIGGLRYSWERRNMAGQTLVGGIDLPPPVSPTLNSTKSWNSVTPRLSLRYAVGERSNLYFTYSQGFKSGVFNTSNTSFADLANPERVRAYEIGFKGRVTDRLSLNAAGFYYDYRGLQASIVTNINGVPLGLLRNAASADIFGLEIDAAMDFGSAFDMRASVSVLDARYDAFPEAAVNKPCTNIPLPGQKCSTVGAQLNIGNTTVAIDASGEQMIRAPKVTASLTANGHVVVAGGKLDLSATLYYTSRVFFTFDHRVSQPQYASLDARASWSPGDSGLTLSVFGRNLTDRTIIAGAFITELADGISWAPPRTYGVQLDYRF